MSGMLALALALVAATGVSVEETPEAAELRRLLAAELGADAVIAGDDAVMRVRLWASAEALELEIRERGGGPVLSRRFELTSGRAAAMRGVIVAIARAVEVETRRREGSGGAGERAEEGAPTASARGEPASDGRARGEPASDGRARDGAASAGGVGAGDAARATPGATPGVTPADARASTPRDAPSAPAEATTRDAPHRDAPGSIAPPPSDTTARALWIGLAVGAGGPLASPLLDAELTAHLALTDRVDVGVIAGIQGLLCCTLDRPLSDGADGLRGELLRARVLASARLRIIPVGPLELSAAAGLGAVWQSMTTTPVGFAGDAPSYDVEAWSVGARAAASIGGPLGGALRWRLDVGTDVHGALSADLPAGFPGKGDGIDTGFLSPFAHLQIELRAF